MPRSRRLLCIAYAVTALLASIATWNQNLSYFHPDDGWFSGFILATARFWPATLATPASTSVTVDLLLLLVPLTALMVIEARRIGVRFVWLYVVFGALVAISVTFPLFLIAREMRLAARGEASESLSLDRADSLVLLVLGVAIASFAVWTIGQ